MSRAEMTALGARGSGAKQGSTQGPSPVQGSVTWKDQQSSPGWPLAEGSGGKGNTLRAGWKVQAVCSPRALPGWVCSPRGRGDSAGGAPLACGSSSV